MPQFDLIIIFPLIYNLIIILIIYYIISINLTMKSINILKFRTKKIKSKLNSNIIFNRFIIF